MYLGETLTTFDGECFPMAGLLPVRTVMCEQLQALKYKEVEVVKTGAFFQPGDRLKGHEFHYSRLTADEGPHALRSVDSMGRVEEEGVVRGGAFASYTHLHLASNAALLPKIAARLRSRVAGEKGDIR
jgi:cobyrinic acid a,c-diamide synthase